MDLNLTQAIGFLLFGLLVTCSPAKPLGFAGVEKSKDFSTSCT